MYLSRLSLYNFRKYKQVINDGNLVPGLIVNFKSGLNVLIGENESGKTTIVDAIRYILQTQSYEYNRIEELDFYYDKETGKREESLKIECEFSGFTDAEAGNFLEWIGFDEKNNYILRIWLTAEIRDGRVIQDVRAGMDNTGAQLDGGARDLLRITYLKPLRDAELEMSSGRRSRFAQLLKSHELFKVTKEEEESHLLKMIVKEADHKIKKYFGSEPLIEDEATTYAEGKVIIDDIKGTIDIFTIAGSENNPFVSLSGVELWAILQRLTLNIDNNQPSLGLMNLLYIAAELMLLKRDGYSGLRMAIIEELEAHLHPHYQLNTLKYFEENISSIGQVILTTHSIVLGSSVKLNDLIICKENCVFPMGLDCDGNPYTKLEEDDTKFLERFLDATKANLFFAKGVIIVEGDAENLLVPAIAEVIVLPIHKHGVSIINVGSKAWIRYAKVFERVCEPQIPMKVAIINDGDIPCLEHINKKKPEIYWHKNGDEYIIETSKSRFLDKLHAININVVAEKREIDPQDYTLIANYVEFLNQSKIATNNSLNPNVSFFSNDWTLEYSIAQSEIRNEMLSAMEKARELSSCGTSLPQNSDNPYELMKPFFNNLSKALTAQFLAKEIIERKDDLKEIINVDEHIQYLVDAIKFACNVNVEVSDNAATE